MIYALLAAPDTEFDTTEQGTYLRLPMSLAIDLEGIDADLTYCGLTKAPHMKADVRVEAGRTDSYERLGIREEDRPRVSRIEPAYAERHPYHYEKARECILEAQFWCSYGYNQFERAGDAYAPMGRRIYAAMNELHKIAEAIRKGEL